MTPILNISASVQSPSQNENPSFASPHSPFSMSLQDHLVVQQTDPHSQIVQLFTSLDPNSFPPSADIAVEDGNFPLPSSQDLLVSTNELSFPAKVLSSNENPLPAVVLSPEFLLLIAKKKKRKASSEIPSFPPFSVKKGRSYRVISSSSTSNPPVRPNITPRAWFDDWAMRVRSFLVSATSVRGGKKEINVEQNQEEVVDQLEKLSVELETEANWLVSTSIGLKSGEKVASLCGRYRIFIWLLHAVCDGIRGVDQATQLDNYQTVECLVGDKKRAIDSLRTMLDRLKKGNFFEALAVFDAPLHLFALLETAILEDKRRDLNGSSS